MDISGIAGYPYNLKDIILSNIGASFFADYGIIDAVNSDNTINVIHAAIPVSINGDVMDVNKTNNIEVLYPASTAFGMNWPLAKGDGVLLVGLKDYVDTTNGIVEPTEAPKVFMHYVQNTMKAIPLQSVTAPKITINAVGSDLEIINSNTGGLIKIANATKSLKTHLSMMETALSTFMGPTSQAAITAGGSSSASLAAAIVALMTAYTSSTATLISDLNALLKA
jgi:hypothetical protein